MMSLHEIHSWTLSGFIRAFFELFFVYFLLCVSMTLFIPSKILKLIGFCFPCPCTGFYGFQNRDLCFHKLFVNLPKRKICLVLDLIKSRFPFDLILIDEQIGYSDRNLLIEIDEPCCSSYSGQKLKNLVDKDSEFDVKGKRIMYPRPKTKIRRRRRAGTGVENVKLSSIVLNDDLQTNVIDDIDESNHIDLGERAWHGFESNGSVGDHNYVDRGFLSLEQATSNVQGSSIIRNEESSIRMWEQALEKEKSARASLYLELEKERASAATAADEAIAMISRLQNDKAAIEMEARQYKRLIEEKFAYDEEEMNILRELLVRREMDNHVLEKEIEAFRQMGFLEKEQSKRIWDYILDKEESSTTIHSDGEELVVQQTESANSPAKETVVYGSTSYSQCFDKQIHFNEEGVLKQTIWTRKDEELKDNSLVCEHITTEAAACGDFDKNYLSPGELQEGLENIDRVGSGLKSSILDMEIDVQDIHVIDEKLHRGNKEERKMDI